MRIVPEVRPGLVIRESRNVDFIGKLYNSSLLYNKDQRYYDGKITGEFPSIAFAGDIKPRIIKVTGGGETYYFIVPRGSPIGLLLTLTVPEEVKSIIT